MNFPPNKDSMTVRNICSASLYNLQYTLTKIVTWFRYGTDKNQETKMKQRYGTITAFGSTARGAEVARSYHKYNEEKIMAHRLCGIMDNDLFITSTLDN